MVGILISLILFLQLRTSNNIVNKDFMDTFQPVRENQRVKANGNMINAKPVFPNKKATKVLIAE